MEFEVPGYSLTIEEEQLIVAPVQAPRRTSNLFYAVIFFWFIYLFAVRILKIRTSLAFDWFMVLLFAALAIYYFITLIVWLIKRNRKTKYAIQKIRRAGTVEKKGNTYAVWQMENEKYTAINFENDMETAHEFLSALIKKNKRITTIGK